MFQPFVHARNHGGTPLLPHIIIIDTCLTTCNITIPNILLHTALYTYQQRTWIVVSHMYFSNKVLSPKMELKR